MVCAAVGLLCVSAAFAEITFSAGGRAVVDIFGIRLSDPVATTAGSETTWNTDGPEVIVKINAVHPDQHLGLNLGISAASSSVSVLRASNAKVWIKPVDWFKITLGSFEEDDLRYKIGTTGSGFGNYELYIRGSARDENVLFHRFKSSGFGTHLTLTPIENLYIGAAFGSVGNARSFTALSENGAVNVFKNIQVGAGYTIPGIGFARLQYIGERPFLNEGIRSGESDRLRNDANGTYNFLGRESTLGNAAAIQAAFQLTAVRGLNIDIAASVPLLLEWEQDDPVVSTPGEMVLAVKSQRPYVAGIGFDVNLLSPFRIYGRVDMETGAYSEWTALEPGHVDYERKEKEGTNLLVSLLFSCNLGDNWIVGLDANMDIRSGDNRDAIPESATMETLQARGGDRDYSLTLQVGESANNYVDLGFGLWIRKNIAGGDIRAAMTLKLPGIAGGAHEGAKPQLFFPVMFNYSI
jgi:hypothetical protein